jgi:TetR/AcrR family transcriptional regulator
MSAPPRRRLPAEARRAQLIGITLRLIAQDGAVRLTASAIAEQAGITDAALFRHFPTLASLIEAAIDHFGDLLRGSLERPETTPRERLAGFFLHRLALVQAHPEVLQLAFNERLADAAGVQGGHRVGAMVAHSLGFLRETLEAAQTEGTLRTDVPVAALLWTVTGHMRGAAMATRHHPVQPAHVFRDLLLLIGPATTGPVKSAPRGALNEGPPAPGEVQ